MKPTAVVGRRFVAFVIDSFVLAVMVGIVFFAMADTGADLVRKLQSGELDPNATSYGNFTFGDTQYSLYGGKANLFFLLAFLITMAYIVVLPGLKGWTLGKLALGLRVVKDDGTIPIGIPRSFVRWILLGIADAFPYLLPYLTGLISMKVNSQNKRIGDMAAGTLVVRKEAAVAGAPVDRTLSPFAATAGPSGSSGSSGLGTGSVASSGLPSDVPAPIRGTSAMPAIPVPTPAPAPAPVAPAVPADWYPDPKSEKRLRYWDGTSWTDHTAD